MGLNLIYHFKTSPTTEGDFKPGSYGVIYFFSEKGFVEDHIIKEISSKNPTFENGKLTFLNLDDLKLFALEVCQELSEKEVRIISAQDYNIGLDGAKDLNGFKAILPKYGEVLVNDSYKKKGLFSKLFS